MNAKKHQKYFDVIESLFKTYPELTSCRESIIESINQICLSFTNGGKLLVCGNGGSASDAEHIVGELMKSFMFKRDINESFKNEYIELFGEEYPDYLEGALPAISLVSQTSLSTAFSNDKNAVGVFAQQVYGYGNPQDIFVGISTSGYSANVLEAAKVAKAKRLTVLSLTGQEPSPLSNISDIAIAVPQKETFRIQELHLPVYHCICAAVEAKLF